ncbi:hypothetical protein ACEWY4_019331 [Coilia grayii]|uniref:LINE-1 type transposase domain-containing 1 n=1 Tax=Coilia grayii TaxID=363190 RepID=A0ABD1JH00_9TELE
MPQHTDSRKEGEHSPIKKKFKESAPSISKADLDSAILAGVKQALAEQRAELNSIVTAAVKAALDDVLLPQISDLRMQLKNTSDTITTTTNQVEGLERSVQRLQSRCDSTQSAARHDRDQVNAMRLKLDELSAKLSEMEDRSRRSNLRLIGLKEGQEGDDCIGFLKANLPIWIPSLADRDIKIERAHRLYTDKATSNNAQSNTARPRTIIFKLLDYTDRQAILSGARAVYPVKHRGDTLHFFPDFSADITRKRKAFTDVRKRIEALGIQTFLLFPATLKITYRGRQIYCRSQLDAEHFVQSLTPRVH